MFRYNTLFLFSQPWLTQVQLATSVIMTLKPKLPTQLLQHPLQIKTTGVGSIGTGVIMLCTKPLLLQVSALHVESISFLVTVTTKHLIILLFSWMQQHDPQISWQDQDIPKWFKQCYHCCLNLPHTFTASTTVESPDFPVTTVIPEIYWDYMEVFSKTKASDLPPHRPYDCVIDLLPGTTPPCNHIYPLLLTEHGRICSWSPPTGLHLLIHLFIRNKFFFVEKRGRTESLNWLEG